MVATYRDGYHVTDIDKATYTVNRMFYPRWWLQAVGFFQHHGVAGGIMFEPAPSGISGFGPNQNKVNPS